MIAQRHLTRHQLTAGYDREPENCLPSFSYRAIDTEGATKRGVVVARDEAEALDALARKGLTATDLLLGARAAVPWWQQDISFSRPNPSRLLPVFVSLATLLKAGVPLTQTFTLVMDQTKDATLSAALTSIRDDLENGRTLRAAIKEHSDVFSDRIITLLSMGETTDTLAQTCDGIVTLLRSEAEVTAEVRSAMVYPLILLTMSLLVLGLLVFYLVPTLLPVFETAATNPPPLLRMMDIVRVSFLTHGWAILAVALACVLVALLIRHRLAAALNWILVRAPITGTYLRKRHSLAMCRSMGVMLEAGMSSLDGLDAAAEAMPKAAWQSNIVAARAEIEAGTSVSDALSSIPFLDPMAKSLIAAGDETDQLVPMLRAASDALQGEVQTTLKRALSLLTPTLTLFIGIVVGVLIVSTITAILDLNDIAF